MRELIYVKYNNKRKPEFRTSIKIYSEGNNKIVKKHFTNQKICCIICMSFTITSFILFGRYYFFGRRARWERRGDAL